MTRFEISTELYGELKNIREGVRLKFDVLRMRDKSVDDISGKPRLERVPSLCKRTFERELSGREGYAKAESAAWKLYRFLLGEDDLPPSARAGLSSEISNQMTLLRGSDEWQAATQSLGAVLGAKMAPSPAGTSEIEGPTAKEISSHIGSRVISERGRSTRPMAAYNRLEKLARFQCEVSGQSGPAGGNIPLLFSFAFNDMSDRLDNEKFTFDLRHAYLRIELNSAILAPLETVDFERLPGENQEVQLQAIRDLGGADYFARWELSGGASLNGRFDFGVVGHTDRLTKDDRAYLQIMARDIRVKLDDGVRLGPAASDVAKQWLRIRKILDGDLPDDGVVNISDQFFNED